MMDALFSACQTSYLCKDYLLKLSPFLGEQLLQPEAVGRRQSREKQMELFVRRVNGIDDVFTGQFQLQVNFDQAGCPSGFPQVI